MPLPTILPTTLEEACQQLTDKLEASFHKKADMSPMLTNSLIGAGLGGGAGAIYGMGDRKKRGLLGPTLAGAGIGGGLGAGYSYLTQGAGGGGLAKDHPLNPENPMSEKFKYTDQRNPDAVQDYKGVPTRTSDLPYTERMKLRRPEFLQRWGHKDPSKGSWWNQTFDSERLGRLIPEYLSDPIGSLTTAKSTIFDD